MGGRLTKVVSLWQNAARATSMESVEQDDFVADPYPSAQEMIFDEQPGEEDAGKENVPPAEVTRHNEEEKENEQEEEAGGGERKGPRLLSLRQGLHVQGTLAASHRDGASHLPSGVSRKVRILRRRLFQLHL
jgi:hypothetical protein